MSVSDDILAALIEPDVESINNEAPLTSIWTHGNVKKGDELLWAYSVGGYTLAGQSPPHQDLRL